MMTLAIRMNIARDEMTSLHCADAALARALRKALQENIVKPASAPKKGAPNAYGLQPYRNMSAKPVRHPMAAARTNHHASSVEAGLMSPIRVTKSACEA